MSGQEVEGVSAGADVEVTYTEHEVSGEPFDAEAHEAESAEHDKFLETYQPCITRLPAALEDERVAYDKGVTEARVQTLVDELGISEDEARESVYGPTASGEDESEPTSEDHASTS